MPRQISNEDALKTADFLFGNSQMGKFYQDYPWENTPVGGIQGWTNPLCQSIHYILANPSPMIIWWGNQAFPFFNDAFKTLFFLPATIDNELIWRNNWQQVKELIAETLSQNKPFLSRNIPFLSDDNQKSFFTFAFTPIIEEGMRSSGVQATAIDTTSRAIQELKLKENEARLHFAVEASDLATWDFNPLTNKFSANRRYGEWFGFSAEELTDNSKALEVIADEDRDRVVSSYKAALDPVKKSVYDIEFKIRPSNAPERTVRAIGKAWFNRNDIAYRFNGILQDISHQKELHEKKLEADQKLKKMISELPIAACLYKGNDLQVEVANQMMLEVWGKDSSIIGQSAADIFRNTGQLDVISDIIQKGRAQNITDVPIEQSINGERIIKFYDNCFKPICGSDDKISSVIHTAVDVTERVQNRRELEYSESRFRNLVSSAPVAMGVFVGRDLRIELPNQMFIDIVGKGDDIVGKPLREVMPELITENQPYLDILDKVYTSGVMYQTFGKVVKIVRNGELTSNYYDITYSPLFDSHGNVYAILDIAIDVTERELVKRRIEENERNLRNIILQAPVAMCIVRGPKYMVEIANEKMFRIWGKSSAEMLNKPFFEAIPQAKDQGFEVLLSNVYHTGETIKAYEVPVLLPRDGSVQKMYLDFVYEAFQEPDGSVSGVMMVAIDVTEQVKARMKIERAEGKARLAIESADLGAYEVDLQNDTISTSERFDAIWGSHGKKSRKAVLDLIHPADRLIRMHAHEEALRTGNLHYEARVIWEDQSIHWIRVKGIMTQGETGEYETLVGVIQDITEQKQFAEELSKQVMQRTVELNRSNEDLLHFAHVASHDLKEPVRKIKVFSNMLEDQYAQMLPQTAKNYLQKIQHATTRMFSMIEGVLAYSALNASQQPIQEVDLNEILKNIEIDLEVPIRQKKASIRRTDLPVIQGATVLLYQLLYNLVNNSLKFSRADVPPEIEITAAVGTSRATIVVADNGIGIDPMYSKQVFNAFSRLNAKDKYEGTGLGLSLCKKIVERHHGSIESSSALGHGARFTITLPLKQPSVQI